MPQPATDALHSFGLEASQLRPSHVCPFFRRAQKALDDVRLELLDMCVTIVSVYPATTRANLLFAIPTRASGG